MRNIALALVASTLAMTGCADSGIMEDDGDRNDSADFIGTYAAVTPVEFTQALASLPALGPALIELRNANANAGEAVLSALQAADVGAMSTVIKLMPSGIRAELVARMNTFLDPVKGDITTFAGQLEQLLKAFEIHSEIRIVDRKAVTGITTEEHRVRSVVFTLNGSDFAVEVPDVVDDNGHGRISSAGKAHLDSVDFELPIGPISMEAAAVAVFPQFGATDLNGALNALIDCDQIGTAIDEVASFVDGQAKCREALASIASKVTTAADESGAEITIAVRDGTGTFQNGVLSGGSWTWTLKLGGFERELKLALEARRQ